jgi:hypothetical protein
MRLGIPTLSGVKAGEKFLKGVPKDNFWNLNIFCLKIYKFLLQMHWMKKYLTIFYFPFIQK